MATTADEIVRLTEELGDARRAIRDILDGGQSVTVGDLSYTEASMPALRALEHALRRQIARLDGTRPAMLRVNLSGVQS